MLAVLAVRRLVEARPSIVPSVFESIDEFAAPRAPLCIPPLGRRPQRARAPARSESMPVLSLDTSATADDVGSDACRVWRRPCVAPLRRASLPPDRATVRSASRPLLLSSTRRDLAARRSKRRAASALLCAAKSSAALISACQSWCVMSSQIIGDCRQSSERWAANLSTTGSVAGVYHLTTR